jgi:putative membrane protein
MPALFAFLHHLAAFAFVSVLAVEFVLMRHELNARTARAILVADAVGGASAGALLAVGLLRVFYFEKGAAYYFHSIPFLAKISLFVLIALLSIYPTVQFLSWRKDLKAGRAPAVSEPVRRRIRSILHMELAALAFLILNAALMAKGIGYAG